MLITICSIEPTLTAAFGGTSGGHRPLMRPRRRRIGRPAVREVITRPSIAKTCSRSFQQARLRLLRAGDMGASAPARSRVRSGHRRLAGAGRGDLAIVRPRRPQWRHRSSGPTRSCRSAVLLEKAWCVRKSTENASYSSPGAQLSRARAMSRVYASRVAREAADEKL